MNLNRTYALLGLLLLLVIAIVFIARPTKQAAGMYYVAQLDGNDTRTCSQATSPNAARRSINAGLACLQPGDTLVVAAGTYDELIWSQQSSERSCTSGDAAVQQPCHTLPNGVSPTQRTRVIASGTDTILSPAGRAPPGGGAAITLLDYARHIHIEGLRIIKHTAAGSTGGIYIGNAQYITLKGNELDDGQIKGGVTSQYLEIIGNHIFNTGKTSCPIDQKPTPKSCPHGAYICGTDHVISDNYVHDTSYYGIQVSCEQGGIARIKLERNRIENNPGNGIRCAGEDCLISANVLRGNGQAITLTGSGLVANNTIDSYYAAAWNSDPTGIWTTWGDGSGFTITNNIFTRQKNAYLLIGSAAGTPPDPAKVHHNMGEFEGNPGVTLIAQASAIYTDAPGGNYTLKPGSPAITRGVAQPQVPVDIVRTAYPVPVPDLGGYSSASKAPPAVDTVPPSIVMSNPPDNERVFSTLTLAATASDNTAVTSVQFVLDGAPYADAVSTVPYTVPFDTTSVSNGTHRVTATATDSAGNSATSPSITLTVDNPSPPDPAPGEPVLACRGTIQGTALQFTCTKPQEVQR